MKEGSQKNPEISVLMSVYDPPSEEIFFEAVDSVISQSFSDWEMILYDDGSHAAGRALIEKAAEKDPRIRLISSDENRGLGYGLNKAVSASRGRYLARMDADDISLPERFRKQYDYLEKDPGAGWVGSNAQLIDKNGRWAIWRMPKDPVPRDFWRYSPFIHPSVMFKREVLESCGGYTQDNKRAEDYELFMRLYANGYRGHNLQEVLFCYREDSSSYSRRKYSSHLYEVRIRTKGFKSLEIFGVRGFFFALKPALVGLIPAPVLARIKRRIRKRTYVAGNSAGKA